MPAAGWGLGAPRFLLYSHDALGLGHVRRNLVIAGALVERCPGVEEHFSLERSLSGLRALFAEVAA
jgi:hypothetical protein